MKGRVKILVGGKGIYFSEIMGGIQKKKEVQEKVRENWRGRMEEEGEKEMKDVICVSEKEIEDELKK